jgi:glutathione S-transferase
MSLLLYYHPLASFCWKVLIALYESETPFEGRIVDLADEASRAELDRIWPVGKFPVLTDSATGIELPESSIIVEYLDQLRPGGPRFVPEQSELAREVRLYDRFFDFYVHQPMQKIVTDKLRPEGAGDPYGVTEARKTLATAYTMLERRVPDRGCLAGDALTLADCSAHPALHYANRVAPLGSAHPRTAAYLERLERRPSVERVLEEAGPYFKFFPG